jgi:hypothetical protein
MSIRVRSAWLERVWIPACNLNSIPVTAACPADCWQRFRHHELKVGKWRFVLYTLFCDKNSHFLGSPTVRWARGNCVPSFCTRSYIGHDTVNVSFPLSSGIHSSKITVLRLSRFGIFWRLQQQFLPKYLWRSTKLHAPRPQTTAIFIYSCRNLKSSIICFPENTKLLLLKPASVHFAAFALAVQCVMISSTSIKFSLSWSDRFLDSRKTAAISNANSTLRDRLCDLVVRVPNYRSKGPGSIPGTTRF